MKEVHIMANINNGSKLTDAEGNLVFPQTDANFVRYDSDFTVKAKIQQLEELITELNTKINSK